MASTYIGPILVVRADELEALERCLVSVNREPSLVSFKARLKRAVAESQISPSEKAAKRAR